MHNSKPINPATGLPMTTDDTGGVDVGGNPYGVNNADIGRYEPVDNGLVPQPWTPPAPCGGGMGGGFGSGFDWP